MKQLSQSHPRPDAALFTVFLSETYDMDDIAYYHMIARNPQDPDSTDLIYIFDKNKNLLGMQAERKPVVQAPPLHLMVDIKDNPSTYNLALPRSFPEFPQYESLVKVLKLNNSDQEETE